MNFLRLSPIKTIRSWGVLFSTACCCWVACSSQVCHRLASLTDDHFEGNIFVLYGGNGSLVPPKVTLAKSLAGTDQLLVFYVDDSSDCKQYARGFATAGVLWSGDRFHHHQCGYHPKINLHQMNRAITMKALSLKSSCSISRVRLCWRPGAVWAGRRRLPGGV